MTCSALASAQLPAVDLHVNDHFFLFFSFFRRGHQLTIDSSINIFFSKLSEESCPSTTLESSVTPLVTTMRLFFFFEGSPEGERIPHLIFHCLCGPRWPDEKGFVTGCSIVLHCLMKNRAPNISKRRVGTGKPACPQPGFSFAVLQ